MDSQEVNHECSVCRCDYTDDEGGIQGYFGILPVSFCPTCFSSMCDMASQYIGGCEEDDTDSDGETVFDYLRGHQYIVINSCYGGFGVSRAGILMYLDKAGISYTLEDQDDREQQIRLGSKIIVNNREFSGRSIDRDDPALLAVVKALGNKANGEHAKLKIVKIPSGVNWSIEEYDGKEWVSEVHRTWQ